MAANAIDRIILPNFQNLKILSMGKNKIRRIFNLEPVAETLEELWISHNLIEKIGDQLKCATKLHTLYITNNCIKAWDEVKNLTKNPLIKRVAL